MLDALASAARIIAGVMIASAGVAGTGSDDPNTLWLSASAIFGGAALALLGVRAPKPAPKSAPVQGGPVIEGVVLSRDGSILS